MRSGVKKLRWRLFPGNQYVAKTPLDGGSFWVVQYHPEHPLHAGKWRAYRDGNPETIHDTPDAAKAACDAFHEAAVRELLHD